jgi:hypothetical protein
LCACVSLPMNWHVGRATGLASRRIMKSATSHQRWLSHVPGLHLPPTRCALCLKCAAPQIRMINTQKKSGT